ncbi:MAG: hypothetical protein Kow0049_02700 [Stanieria sp.]
MNLIVIDVKNINPMSVEKLISNQGKITIMRNIIIKKTDIQSFIYCLDRKTQAMLGASIYLIMTSLLFSYTN